MTDADADLARTPAAIIKRLALLQQLTLDAVQAGSRRELEFLVVNRTAAIVRYDRASLWRPDPPVRFLAVSGRDETFPDSPVGLGWRRDIGSFLATEDACLVPPDKNAAGTMALWLPIQMEGKPYAGLLLERFSGPNWTDDEIRSLRPLARAYAGAFRIFRSRTDQGKERHSNRRRFFPAILALIAIFLLFFQLPLRIVAQAEVVPAKLIPVNAPLDGVIREIGVKSGQAVKPGDILYAYDETIMRQELDIASHQVEVTRSNLERAAAQAGARPEARAEAGMLRNRLAQDLVRRDALRERMEKVTVPAPEAGVVIMGNPADFIGRPVTVGEAVVAIAGDGESIVRIRLPLDDRIDFDPAIPLRVFLNADAGTTRTATLTHVDNHATPGDDGVYGFMAEATWLDGSGNVNLGLKGTAILYGERVSLGYWLLRKPLATLRRFFGL